ncbi:MAG: prenyltransferase/squalene oxidase repeat-containing protein [Planctomycetota bacterium]
MSKEDLKLLFDTERQILRRRLKALFPSGSPYRPDDGARPSKGPHGRRDKSSREGSGATAAGAAQPPAGPGRRRALARKPHSLKGLVTSMAVHVVLLAILLPIVISEAPVTGNSDTELVVRFITLPTEKEPREETQPKAPEVVVTPDPVPEPEPVPTEPEQPVEPAAEPDPEPSEPAPAEPEDHGLAGKAPAAGSGDRSPLGARYGEKAQALLRYGGNTSTEHAVAKGLQWLADHQDRDGSWSPDRYTDHCHGAHRCGGVGFPDYRVGVSALALLAFLGAGVTDAEHPLRPNVEKGLTYLLTVQDASGCVGPRKGNYMYNHAISAFCLAEAALLTERDDLRRAAERALEFSALSQQAGGGWDYTAAQTFRNDLSITGWQVMALHAAQQANLVFPPELERKVRNFIRRAVHRNGTSTYADRGIGEGRRGVSIAAVGLLSKLYLGWSPRSPEVERAIERIMRRPPDDAGRVDWDHTYQSSYYWYYATLSLFHHGGEAWDAWNTLLQRHVLPLQSDRGHRAGSWDPDPNWIGAAGGRVATTAMLVLTFEVYYRYTPLWKKFGLPDRERTKQ